MRRRRRLVKRLIEKVWPPRLVDILANVGGICLMFGFAGLDGAVNTGEGYLLSLALVVAGCIAAYFYIKEGGN